MKIWFSIVISAFCLVPLFGQSASVRGVVTDESGGVVPGAVVTIAGASVPVKTTRTNAEGTYSINGVQPGEYVVRAAASGLALPEPVKITLQGGTQTLNLELKVAAMTEQVTVGDTADSTVTTDPAGNASAVVMRGEDLDALSDNPDDLATDLQNARRTRRRSERRRYLYRRLQRG